MDERRLETRLEAVERALTDGESIPELTEAAEAAADAAARERRIDDLEERVAELEAATQALRGYVGSVRSVNESVEERADAALATVEDLDERVAALEAGVGEDPDGHTGDASETDRSQADKNQGTAGSDSPPPVATEDPQWLATADDRLPDEEPTDESAPDEEEGGLAARLGGLL